jgi:UDP-sulfoquinovose synthase
MRVLILGGDGYLGWQTAMILDAHGHDVYVVDNYLRRNLCLEQDVEYLFPVPNLPERTRLWEKKHGGKIKFFIGDLTDWHFIAKIFKKVLPEGIVHYAEQPSAPYSMLNRKAAALTLKNNIEVTANVIFAVREFVPEAQIVKIGTMGEYGTPNIDIEEGWIEIELNKRKSKFLYPRQASSLYHTTKIMDTDLLWFYVRMWKMKVTDLMQGPVYGLVTDENENDTKLFPFFNYDELFGTVLNRFVVQAVAGYPLTVYGKGGQTRGYLDIRDTLQCVRLSLEKPASEGELRIFNQFVETFSVNDLARRVQKVGNELGLKVEINSVPNPRIEAEEHYYNPKHTGLVELGLKPHFLNDEYLADMIETILSFKDNIRKSVIFSGIKWK